ncbi:DUF3087 family protein [Thiomicrorhabdus sp. zzn3]|uniref:DUF3087 family protein n=1 Tax=Thiomicrorhabdus sp. zzn3 TaxID=3039775 RepID=UPI00243711E8|nr:DUF3087 family protein [Thiomicrorhabdus sp. zzn3]MDG6778403.1 DUF3087 family protein [Thiomicrorhabdus sp. zzn3]
MFELQEIDPQHYRKQTRKSTMIIMAMFMVVGLATARLFVHWLGDYSNNLIVLNFMGAFAGLVLTGFIVKWFFKDQPWMKEAMYAWRLKRSLMHITNKLRPIQEAVEAGDEEAMKILRFYHLGLAQMHRLEENSTALIDLQAEKHALETRLREHGIALEQRRFDPQWVERFSHASEAG